MKLPILSFLIAAALMTACNGSMDGYKKISPSFGYKIVSDLDTGTAAGKGSFLVLDAAIRNEQDSMIKDQQLGQGFYMELPVRAPRSASDLMLGFNKLSDGDSAIFRMLADTFFAQPYFRQELPPNVETGSYITFHVKVQNLLDSMEHEAWAEQKELESRALAYRVFQSYIKAAGIESEPVGSGIYMVYEKQGKGKMPVYGQVVTVNYICMTMEGRLIGNTYTSGLPYRFRLGTDEVVQGVNEAVMRIRKGDKARVIIPHYLAYGKNGAAPDIGPYTHLVYDIEVLDFED